MLTREFLFRFSSVLIVLIEGMENKKFKEFLPQLFHGFRNKYSHKISLDSMRYFHAAFGTQIHHSLFK